MTVMAGRSGGHVHLDQLEERDNLVYFEEKLFTGIAVSKYLNGQKEMEATFKDGRRHGLSTSWHKNGQKWSEVPHKDGKPIFSSEKRWDEDGNPK